MPETLAKLLSDRLGITDLAPVSNRCGNEGYKCVCKGAEAVARWQKLRALADESGYWPVILGDDKEVGRILGVVESEHGVLLNQILYRVASETAEGWLKERRESNQDGGHAEETLHGGWPEQADPLTMFTIPLERGPAGFPEAQSDDRPLPREALLGGAGIPEFRRVERMS